MSTYTFVSNDDQEAGISDARDRFNRANPDTPIADNQGYLTKVFTDATASWEAAAVHAALTVTQKAQAAVILQEAVARNDGNSPGAAALLALLQSAQ